MVVCEVVSTGCCHYVKLVGGECEASARSSQGASESIAGIGHTVFGEDRLKTAFIECGIVSYKCEPFEAVDDLCPDVGECRSSVCVATVETVHLLTKPGIIVGDGPDKAVKLIHNHPSSHYNDANAAHR